MSVLVFTVSLRINSWYSVVVGRWRASSRLTIIVLRFIVVARMMIMAIIIIIVVTVVVVVVVSITRHVIISS